MSSFKHNKLFVFSLMFAGFIGSLSQNMMTAALPAILSSFHTDTAKGQWLTNIFILILGITAAASAYLFSRFLTKKLVLSALGIFMIGCALSLSAQNFYVLLLSRLIQGVGAGVLIPTLQISLLHIFPKENHGQALGITGIIIGFAPAAGITLAGVFIDSFGWRSIFLFLLILGAAIWMFGFCFLQNIGTPLPVSMDYSSLFLYSAGAFFLMIATTFINAFPLPIWILLLLFAAGIVCLFRFAKRQLLLKSPLLELRLFCYTSVKYAAALFLITFTLMMCGTTLFPLYIQTICGRSATFSGLLCLPGSIMIAVVSPAAGRLADRFRPGPVCIAGALLLIIGTLPFIFFSQESHMLLVCFIYTLQCTGIALLLTASLTMGVYRIPLAKRSHSTAILNSFRQVFGSLFASLLITAAAMICAPSDLNLSGIRGAFLIMTAACVILLFGSIRYHSREDPPKS